MQIHETQHKAPAGAHEQVPRDQPGVSARFLPRETIAACTSFRDAVCLAWDNRARRGMTQRTLAELLEIKPSHMSNMLSREPVDRHGKPRQDLPARYIADFERVVGNRGVAQYLARMAMLTLMEEVIAQRTP
ncbi:helix-turn-helix domain-containing protein [Paraburkholderia sediminicola]|uniref:helix-turn-helix domain-containing protein n=1 Tax=Paraburkholderia sediminicola TaxID=458836 RepID=UPI0038BD8E72